MNEQTEKRSGFKFDKTISLGHVLTVVSFLLAGTAAWHGVDTRIVRLEDKMEEMKEMKSAIGKANENQALLLRALDKQDVLINERFRQLPANK